MLLGALSELFGSTCKSGLKCVRIADYKIKTFLCRVNTIIEDLYSTPLHCMYRESDRAQKLEVQRNSDVHGKYILILITTDASKRGTQLPLLLFLAAQS